MRKRSESPAPRPSPFRTDPVRPTARLVDDDSAEAFSVNSIKLLYVWAVPLPVAGSVKLATPRPWTLAVLPAKAFCTFGLPLHALAVSAASGKPTAYAAACALPTLPKDGALCAINPR